MGSEPTNVHVAAVIIGTALASDNNSMNETFAFVAAFAALAFFLLAWPRSGP
jgi:hypothetical protein